MILNVIGIKLVKVIGLLELASFDTYPYLKTSGTSYGRFEKLGFQCSFIDFKLTKNQ